MRAFTCIALPSLLLAACGVGDRGESLSTAGLTAGGTDGSGGSVTAGSQTSSGSDSTGDDSGDDDDGVVFDVMDGDGDTAGDTGNGECGCGSTLSFSYIWIANTGEGTVSKINTQTLEEEGRYLTRADGSGSPSRTSVSLSGRTAAVANRNGGVIAIHAVTEACDPMTNGQPGLQTSSGKGDVLPWGQDDCIAWYTDFSYQSQRPIAWIAGDLDQATCTYSAEKLWTSGKTFSGTVTAHLLNGDTGQVEQNIPVTGFDSNNYGGYGGAVDSDGNFWLTNWDRADIAVVYRDGSGAKAWQHSEVGGYGITVDSKDRVWTTGSYQGGVARFDPVTQQWDIVGADLTSATGLAQDVEGRVWTGGSLGSYDGPDVLVWIDADTMEVGGQLELDGFPKGVSIDQDGFVWVVTFERVHKVDPDTMMIVGSYDGLDSPYTYSDMTGWGLQNTACPTPEG